MSQLPQNPNALHVRGAWSGPIGDPSRAFHGVLLQEAPPMQAGTPVTVTYQTGDHRTPGPHEHGTYRLHHGEGQAARSVTLMSFTCRAAATTGPKGHDDTQEADWQAVPLP